jgi:hypothetical protein
LAEERTLEGTFAWLSINYDLHENRVADGTIGGRTMKPYTTRKPSFVPKSKRDWPTSYRALEKAPRWMIMYILVFYHEISIEVQF